MYENTSVQAVASYPYNGDVMLEANKKFVLSTGEKQKLNNNIKFGIYKELNSKSLLTDGQLSLLMEKQRKFLQ